MVEKPRVSVIILTHNEASRLPDCLRSLRGLEAELFVVDSGSTDATRRIAREAGCRVFDHPFENYASQRNWALRQLPIDTKWVLCLDADERLTPELVDEINGILRDARQTHQGYLLRKRTYFMGRWIKHGGQYPSYHLRLFLHGHGRCEDRLYDQHFLVDGNVGRLENDYLDVLSSDLSRWTERHNRWATLEAREVLAERSAAESTAVVQPRILGSPIERKRFLRVRIYQAVPLFARAFLFWIYGYVFRLGFLDGVPGLIFHTLQRFWFRFLVDAKIYELRRKRARDRSSGLVEEATSTGSAEGRPFTDSALGSRR